MNRLFLLLLLFFLIVIKTNQGQLLTSGPREICEQGMYPCSSTSTMCIPQEKFCDGHIDCEDKLDEVGCVSITYNRPTESSILNTYTHRPSNHRIYTTECSSGSFRCSDGTCIELRQVCDGIQDCSDGRDEQCNPRQLTRQDSIQSPYVYGSRRRNTTYQYNNNQVSSYDSQYTRRTEVTTPEPVKVKILIYDSTQTVNLGNDVVFRCRDESSLRAPVFWSRSDNQQLPYNAHDSMGRLSINKVNRENEGIYICQANGHPDKQTAQLIIRSDRNSDPSSNQVDQTRWSQPTRVQAPLTPVTSSSDPLYYEPASYTTPPSRTSWPSSYTYPIPTSHSSSRVASIRSSRKMRDCQPGYISCRDGSTCIARSQVCDYRIDCPDGSDEEGCRKKCINHQFTCGSLCLDKNKRCDGIADCNDGTDEFQCRNECGLSSYWCPGSQECIPQAYQCDGEYDCPDGADEKKCEKPRMIQQPEKSYTVEKGKSITLSCRASGFPKPTIEWRFNFQKVPMVASSQISVCTTCHNCTENEAISSLTLANFDERLEGKWTCEAVNSVDTSLAPHDTDLALRPASSYVSGVY